MQTLQFTFPVRPRPAVRSGTAVHIGVVASGDLEILLTGRPGRGTAQVTVRTSADGFDEIWHRVLERFFAADGIEADYLLDDFGATPGMVTLRLAQAQEAVDGTPEEGR